MPFPSGAPVILATLCTLAGGLAASEASIAAGINSWAFDEMGTCLPRQTMAAKEGITHWSDAKTRIRVFFWIGSAGPLTIHLVATVAGEAKIRCALGTGDPPAEPGADAAAKPALQGAQDLALTAASGPIPVGTFTVARPGYQYLELQGLSRTKDTFAEVASVELSGAFAADQVHAIKDDVHFGRRGPSVHLGYHLPKAAHDIAYVYNEVCVPVGKDAIGTYCMANGFGEGYSGMQVNSATERRILFSVWSPFTTNDPKAIPEADRVTVLKQGKDVHAQAFGGEGSGGQSFLVYPWKAGVVYRFLLHGEPGNDNATVYTAYFSPEPGQWRLLASFRRPRTTTWLTGWHSFLENFSPDAGAITREATFANQWACDRSGQWFAATEARFTADATAHKQARLDYTGGVTADGRFFLRNCGFFSEHLAYDTVISRPAGQQQPVIDFAKLPQE
jgi:hypothetical protein